MQAFKNSIGRQYVGAAALFVLVSGLAPLSSANAAIKINAKCIKKNQIVKSQGVDYKCTLSSGKLKWKLLNSSSNNSDTAQIDAQNISILKKSFSEIRSFSDSNVAIKSNFYLDPTMDKSVSSMIMNGQNNVLQKMSGLLNPPLNLNSIIADNIDYILDSYSEIEKNLALSNKQLSNESLNMLRSCMSGCAFASLTGDGRRIPYLTYLNPGDKLSTKEVGAHEAFHIIQVSLNKDSGNLPCWVREGQASFVGSALSDPNESFDSTIETIKSFGGMHSAGSDLALLESPEGWKGHAGNCQDLGEYQVGRIANAYLVAQYGWSKSIEFLRNMNGKPADGLSWKNTFDQTFGKSVSDFYSEVRIFIDWFFAKYFHK